MRSGVILLKAILLLLLACGQMAAAQSEKVMIENEGWNLAADLMMPKSRSAVPSVVLLNKAMGDRQVYKELAQELAKLGIASLRVDLRAHGESTNKGKFGPPFDAAKRSLLAGSDTDISAAVAYLKGRKEVDPHRIGFVGASYSGEEMAISARKSGYGRAYVALSPGSFSDESIKNIDTSGVTWLFIRSAEEPNLRGFFENVRRASKSAQLLEVAGSAHASDLLNTTPGLAQVIAAWLKHRI